MRKNLFDSEVYWHCSSTLIICIMAASDAPSVHLHIDGHMITSEIKMHLGWFDYRASSRVVNSQRSVTLMSSFLSTKRKPTSRLVQCSGPHPHLKSPVVAGRTVGVHYVCVLLLSACLLCCLIVCLALELQLVSGPEEILLVPLLRNEGSSPEGWTEPHVFSESISDWAERSVPRWYFNRICLQIWLPVIANAAADKGGGGLCLINFTCESEIFGKTKHSVFCFSL